MKKYVVTVEENPDSDKRQEPSQEKKNTKDQMQEQKIQSNPSPSIVLEVAKQEYVHGFERSAKLDNKISITMVACTLIFPLMGDLIFKLLEINQKVTEAKINAVKESDLKALEILQKMVSEYNILLIVDIVFFFILVVGMVLLLLGTKLKAFEPGFLLKKDIYSLNELTQARLLGYYYNDFSSSNNRMLERKFRIFNILSVLFIPVTVISFFLAYFSTVILR